MLKKASELTGLPVAVEVATAKHVEDCLPSAWTSCGWAPAPLATRFRCRKSQQPCAASIFRCCENPIHPELELWVGAIERLQKVGLKQVGMVHRGFSSYGNTDYRNAPMWHLPIEMKRRMPDMPILNDPSHICGRRDTLSAWPAGAGPWLRRHHD